MYLIRKNILFIITLCFVLLYSCKKDETPNQPVISANQLAYSNLIWNGGNEHYWSIYTISIDGSNDKKFLESSIGLSFQEWSPDGSKILANGMATPTSAPSIYIMNSDGTNLQRLTQMTDAANGNWSPDGKKITFTKYNPEQNYQGEIYLMDADGNNPKSMFRGQNSRFSPDGKKIAYVSNETGNNEIFLRNVDGSNPVKLTNTYGDESDIDISPDGTKIVYSYQNDPDNFSSCEIYVINIDGTNTKQITTNSVLDGQPRWSLDGTQIAFSTNTYNNPEICLMNADGTNLRRVTNANGRRNSANTPSWIIRK